MTNRNLYCVQIGSGLSCPSGWINFDASPTLRFERIPIVGKWFTKNSQRFPDETRYGDITKKLSLPRASCVAIYASHVLEHLSLADFQSALSNIYALLALDGVFRLVVPDLETLVNRYVKSNDPEASKHFMSATYLGRVTRCRNLFKFVHEWLGHQYHLWMWDFKSLRYELEQAGFANIQRCEFGKSSNPKFLEIESFDRSIDSVIIECEKLKPEAMVSPVPSEKDSFENSNRT